ncbi:MAG: ATPase, partial [Candidatus Altiarchaeales archaeon HGW-Altiarchaeales-3]
MKFINRKSELKNLSKIKDLSKEKFWFVVIYGIRRVGKTRLILEFIKNSGVYFFVNKNKSSETLLMEFSEILKKEKIIGKLEVIPSWDDFFEVLINRCPATIVFDEFQNFNSVNKEIFGILQKVYDLNEDKPLMMIFSGSTIGLLKKTFNDQKEPLYGRVKQKINLKPLNFYDTIDMCNELGFKDMELIVSLYALFGGFPKYYVAIEDYKLHGETLERILDSFFFEEMAVLEDEVLVILSQEFGARSGIYYSILEAIACGSNSISEIAGYLNKPVNSITRHITELHKYFEILRLERPVIKGSKKGQLFINHPLINFWFRFFYKNYSLYEQRDLEFIMKVKEQLPAFIGFQFEELCRKFFMKMLLKELQFKPGTIGRQWGKIPGGNTYEIDIVA